MIKATADTFTVKKTDSDAETPSGPSDGIKDVYKRQPETLCLQAVEVLLRYDRVLFVERSGELSMQARLSA